MITIRDAVFEDLQELVDIYNYAIINLTATFDLEPQTIEERKKWFDAHGGAYPLIVAEETGDVIGYATLSPYNIKSAYKATAELSIYIAPDQQGKGIGTKLMEELLKRAEELSYHTLISGITAGNAGSVRLHKRFGFKLVGTMKEVGFKFGEWQNTDYYQLMIHEQFADLV
ncbi:N-acetyltransferase family protein [Oceanobacillus piezotolerans]|uniref:N-acetyltransferase family protein n=1 Tax=Oceanobacillus piezotolerans TaxID=2448030 RepID=A0A498DG85_9BACI|nr:GNAT family N-acetyltransferase [Oceanobacillus piezotolerans]RLL43642.1 N-acetyltransferase family protein [Oceanobacillus piezotolerans]